MTKRFTKEEDDFLMKNYLLIPAKRMSKMLGRSESGARQRMKLLGIVVPKEVAERFKKESQIKKGTQPPNKGKKWSDYMTEDRINNCLKTTFKKGTVPPNYKPVGSERTSKDGYIEIKVGEGMRQWRLKHRVIYEQHFGKIPKGYNVEFKDRNRLNISPENLILRSRKENMKLNSVQALPEDVRKTIQMLGAINRQINKRTKQSV